jgi:hypothetical protein
MSPMEMNCFIIPFPLFSFYEKLEKTREEKKERKARARKRTKKELEISSHIR